MRASPAITRAAAASFQPGSDSRNHTVDAPMPNTGTSNAIGESVDQTLERASQALREAKAQGPGHVVVAP